MIRLKFFIAYALNRLRHGGQRVLIALLAVAFGVMSLVAMSSMAEAVDRVMTADIRLSMGGDIRATPDTGDDTLEVFARLKQDGLIEAYSPRHQSFTVMMRTDRDGQARFVQNMIAIDPQTYPLVGDMMLEDGSTDIGALLSTEGAALVTRDLALSFDLHTGDLMRFAQMDGQTMAAPLRVAGILSRTPDHYGQRVFYSLATMEALFGSTSPFDHVLVKTENSAEVAAELEAAGWRVQRADLITPTTTENQDLFSLMLRGAGVLGLIVGGIGIANTMNVLLAQRRREVGILKTLGFSAGDMMALFLLEALLLGIAGSVTGALAAVLLSRGITQMFANMSALLITWEFNPVLTLGGVLVGIATTVLFALYAIVRASNVRPTVIFRQDDAEERRTQTRLTALAFYAALAVPFAGITTLVMRSVVNGVGVLLFALAGLIGFSIVLSMATWVILRLLPVLRFNLLRIARSNMYRRAGAMLFAMIALTVGIFTMGFALTIVQVSMDQFGIRRDMGDGPDLMVYTESSTAADIEQALAEGGAHALHRRYVLRSAILRLGSAFEYHGAQIQARETDWDIEITDGVPFSQRVEGVYIPDGWPAESGTLMQVEMADGTAHELPVVGRYRNRLENGLTTGESYPIVSLNMLQTMGQPQVTVFAEGAGSLGGMIGQRFPYAMTLTADSMADEMNRAFMNVLGFALAMSGLALLAGVMLSANVVSLAMIERRSEIGVMKAVGYTQRHILTVIALEYGLAGLIAGLVGLIGVQAVITLLTMVQSGASRLLFISPLTALIVLLGGILLTVATAVASAWQPTSVRPQAILNARAS